MKNSKIKNKLILLIVLFVLGLLSLHLLNKYFDNLVNDLNKQTINQKSKIRIGKYISQDITKINLLINVIATSSNSKKSRNAIIDNLNKEINDIKNAINILNEGGTLKKYIRLNIAGRKNIIEYITYYPKKKNLSIVYINITPKLTKINNMIKQLTILLEARKKYKDQNDIKGFVKVVKNIKRFYKTLPPFFVRLAENSHRLSYEAKLELNKINIDIDKQKNTYNMYRTIFIILILIAIFIYGYYVSEQIIKLNKDLERKESTIKSILNAQSNIIIVSNGKEIIDSNNSLIEFFDTYKEIKEFTSKHACICDYFDSNVPNEFYVFKKMYGKLTWIEYVLNNPDRNFRVIINRKGKKHHFSLVANKKLIDGEKLLVISLNDITNEIEIQNELSVLNENLDAKVEEKTKMLEAKYEELKNTQSQLIQSEKMASLGGMVAGVAHEINTPVGMALTAITHNQDILNILEQDYFNEEMSEDDFTDFLQETKELNNSIFININKAAELIRSFKQVAVDQSSDENRVFNLKVYVQEILSSLHNKIKKTKHTIIVNIKDDLQIDSNPGAFSQILTNFIMNSIIHGFDKNDEGKIIIEAILIDNNLKFVYKDNGKGINTITKQKIFDPFYTTNRANGSSGLGMNIVFNLVTKKLQGTIELNTNNDKGIEFIINIPI